MGSYAKNTNFMNKAFLSLDLPQRASSSTPSYVKVSLVIAGCGDNIIGDKTITFLALNSSLAGPQTALSVSLSNVTLQNFGSPSINRGGGIYARGDKVKNNMQITLTSVNIRNCASKFQGGGLYFLNVSNVLISHSSISNCTSIEGGGVSIDGVNGFRYEDSVMMNNKASPMDATTAIFGGGGGLSIRSSSNIIFLRSTLLRNELIKSIFFSGGGMFIRASSNISIISTLFSANDAHGGHGGGICSPLNSFNIKILKSSFLNNHARDGGGVAIRDSNFIDIIDSDFIGNRVQMGGGGLDLNNITALTLDSVNVSGNSVAYVGAGGGLTIASCFKGIIKSSTITNNTAALGGGNRNRASVNIQIYLTLISLHYLPQISSPL